MSSEIGIGEAAFGPAVIGAAKADFYKQQKAIGAFQFGAAVTGVHQDGTPWKPGDPPFKLAPTAPAVAVKEPPSALAGDRAVLALSVAELTKTLAEHPDQLDGLLALEKTRQPGPRVAAIRLFLKYELERPGGPRPEVQGVLEQLA